MTLWSIKYINQYRFVSTVPDPPEIKILNGGDYLPLSQTHRALEKSENVLHDLTQDLTLAYIFLVILNIFD